MRINIDTLLRYEKYIPVLTEKEQDVFISGNPTLAQLQDWQHRLDLRTARIDCIFHRAYNKQKSKSK